MSQARFVPVPGWFDPARATVDEVKVLQQSALQQIDQDRLMVAPDCGLGFFSAGQAEAKLWVMCEAVVRV